MLLTICPRTSPLGNEHIPKTVQFTKRTSKETEIATSQVTTEELELATKHTDTNKSRPRSLQ